MCKLYNLGFGLCLFFVSNFTFSITTPFVDTGNLLKSEQYTFALHSQFIFTKKQVDGNMILYFDTGKYYKKSINNRFLIGYGESGLFLGSLFKLILFPDYNNQPAIGASLGITYNIFNQNNHYLSFHLRPFLSKNVRINKLVTYYIALPISMRFKNFKSLHAPIRITIGARGGVGSIRSHKIELNIELSKELTNDTNQPTTTYLTIGLIVNN